MKLLILGGTIFVGRYLVDAALAHGHEVTLFNRGRTNPDLFPNVEKLYGDRDGNLTALQNRRWDAVIDISGFLPRVVRASAELLAKAVDHYTFISSVMAYRDLSVSNIDESAPVGTLPDETTEEITDKTYGPLKALCERVIEQIFPGRSLCIRPVVVVGPHDPFDRFIYWVHRVAQGGDVLAPGNPDRCVQILDVRDLAEWLVRLVEADQTGTYNATGPDYPLTMEQMLHECQAISGSDARFVWVSEQFLLEAGIQPGVHPRSEMPLWTTETSDIAHIFSVNCDKAVAAGLAFRPLGETIRDTLHWITTLPPDREWHAGMKRDRELKLLQTWHTQMSGKGVI